MKISIVTIFVILMFPQAGLSQTLCLKDEIDYFSCQTIGSKKLISVCGNIVKGKIDNDSWLQYRFGRKDSIELAYPVEKRGSISKFEGNFFPKYGAADLRFINGKVLYGVYISGGDEETHTPSSGGVGVELGRGKRANVQCQHIDTEKYYSRFMELNGWLSSDNGKANFRDHFFESAP